MKYKKAKEITTEFTSKDVQWALTVQWRDGSSSIEYYDNPADAKYYLNMYTKPIRFNAGQITYPPSAIYGIIECNDNNWVCCSH